MTSSRHPMAGVQTTVVATAVAVLLTMPFHLCAQSATGDNVESERAPSIPAAGERVRLLRLLPIPLAVSGRAEAAVADQQSLYVAGRRWNKEDKSTLWVWRVDELGVKVWEVQLAQQQRNEELKIVGLLPGAKKFRLGSAVEGVRVVYRQGLETRLVFLNRTGNITFEKVVGQLENTHGLLPNDQDEVYLFGSSMTVRDQPGHAWVGRLGRLGTLQWKVPFHARDSADAQASRDVPAGHYANTFLLDAAMLNDGSAVLVGQEGVYNKFGQGPSKLCLLRITGNGKQVGQAFIDGGRLFPAGSDLIVRSGDGVIVPYTTDQLPPIAGAPGNIPFSGFSVRLAHFDDNLNKLWDKPFSVTSMPGATTITRAGPLVSLSAQRGVALVRCLNDQGDEQWIARASTPDSFVTPLAALPVGDGMVAVFNHRATNLPANTPAQSVLLVFLQPPAD